MSVDVLLAALSDGEFHSGGELGELLGVSRTAIWKQLKKIEDLGISLISVKGKGYCVEGGVELLSENLVYENLSSGVRELISTINISGVVTSTNELAMRQAVAGNKGYVCVAEQQTAGRGRRGRHWVSPYGCNVYMSVVWEFAGGAAALEGLSLAVGVAVVDALAKVGVDGLQLKWPNDVLYNGKKLGGILLEMTGDAAGICQVVVGVGLNIAMSESTQNKIDQPWVGLSAIMQLPVSRNVTLALLLNELIPLLNGFEVDGFGRYRSRWQQLDAFSGKEVMVKLGADDVQGLSRGVDVSGALLVETVDGVRSFNGGEVSLRAL
jgi:BirA family biotin operon repressor/biotin-[acetyl-CoA-carboxylase] ligase